MYSFMCKRTILPLFCGFAAEFLLSNYMPKTRAQKEQMIVELIDKLNRMKSAVFVNYHGIKVVDIEGLRKKLYEVGVDYQVVKNTLFTLALKKSNLKLDFGELNGPVAVAISFADEIAPARVLAQFGREHKQLEIFRGILEGEVIEGARVVELSRIPSREQLLARLVGSIHAPVSNFVGVLRANVSQILYALQAIAKQK